MKNSILTAAFLMGTLPLNAETGLAPAMSLAQEPLKGARAFAEERQDRVLSTLYERLFRLQDLRREAEIRVETFEYQIDDIFAEYKRLDRFIDSKEELKEIALDPEHRNYPRLGESTKIKYVEHVAIAMRKQRTERLTISKIERDINDVNKMIERYLASRKESA